MILDALIPSHHFPWGEGRGEGSRKSFINRNGVHSIDNIERSPICDAQNDINNVMLKCHPERSGEYHGVIIIRATACWVAVEGNEKAFSIN